jgi:alpha,alpha-trehalase
MRLFAETLLSDLADVQGGTTREGVHLAAMAGSVDLIQRCFTGLEARHDRLALDPSWPDSLGAVSFAVTYRSQPLTVCLRDGIVEVRADPGMWRPVRVVCRGDSRELVPGSAVRFRVSGEARAV